MKTECNYCPDGAIVLGRCIICTRHQLKPKENKMDKLMKIGEIAKAHVELLTQKELVELATEILEAELLEETDEVIEELFKESVMEDGDDDPDGFVNEAHYQAYRNGAV